MTHTRLFIVKSSCAWGLRRGRPASKCGNEVVVRCGVLIGFMQRTSDVRLGPLGSLALAQGWGLQEVGCERLWVSWDLI